MYSSFLQWSGGRGLTKLKVMWIINEVNVKLPDMGWCITVWTGQCQAHQRVYYYASITHICHSAYMQRWRTQWNKSTAMLAATWGCRLGRAQRCIELNAKASTQTSSKWQWLHADALGLMGLISLLGREKIAISDISANNVNMQWRQDILLFNKLHFKHQRTKQWTLHLLVIK